MRSLWTALLSALACLIAIGAAEEHFYTQAAGAPDHAPAWAPPWTAPGEASPTSPRGYLWTPKDCEYKFFHFIYLFRTI
nr:unnamed protein product [Callosobruchus analis]